MASTVESVQPSTSNLMNNPLIPTTITAEILVENIPSSQSVSSSVASGTVVSAGSQLLAAISSATENENAGDMGQSSEATEKSTDEPDAKRRKLDNAPAKSKIVEKLELRLGGILCCAVCLDLPRTAMYQVSYNSSQPCTKISQGAV